LRGVSLEVPRGSFIAIMGASGSGKSTLLHLMAGLTRADSGSIRVDGIELSSLGDHQLTLTRRRKIGLVFQSFNLVPMLSARQNMLLPFTLDGRRDDEAHARVDRLLETLGLSPRAHHRPDALSGGEQQRVAIGRALVTDPAVVLADEPTGNLDSTNSRIVCELLRDLSIVHGKTIVMVTHEPSVAAYAQEVLVLRDGLILERFATDGPGAGAHLATRYHEAVRA
jgi:putative ABC transport system ATP-binding protein